MSQTVIGTVIHTRTGAGFVALTTRPGGKMIFSGRKEPVVDRQQQRRGDALEDDLRRRTTRGDAGIVESRHLRADAAQIDGHLVAVDFDPDLDRNMLAEIDAVVVHERLRLVNAVGNLAHRRARQSLALLVDQLDALLERLVAVALEQAAAGAARRSGSTRAARA